MDKSKRNFLKIAGVSLLGITAKPVLHALAACKKPPTSCTAESHQGKNWAMVIDMKKCKTGCKDCINACHRLHHAHDRENYRESVARIGKEPYQKAFPGEENRDIQVYLEKNLQGNPYIVLCNHCENPPCVTVCPTRATWKRQDGIVVVDDHQCIGCKSCVEKCAFGARRLPGSEPGCFNNEKDNASAVRLQRNIEKCNFCAERLADGLLPACVEACKEKVMVFGDLKDPHAPISGLLSSNYTIRRKPGFGTMPQVYYIA